MTLDSVVSGLLHAALFPLAAPAEAVGLLRRKVKFDNECKRMQRFFNTPQGFVALADFFGRAETAVFDEPAGILNPHNYSFTFIPPSAEKKTLYKKVIIGDAAAINEVLSKVKKIINLRTKNGETSCFFETLAEKLEAGKTSKDTCTHIDSLLKNYFSSYCHKPTGITCNDVFVHIHPNKECEFEKDGMNYVNTTRKGYSFADIEISQMSSLGLVEYSKEVNPNTSTPQIKIQLSVSHRFAFIERNIGQYVIDANSETTVFNDSRGRVRRIKTPRMIMSKFDALKLLSESAYVLPFIEFDASADMAADISKSYDAIRTIDAENTRVIDASCASLIRYANCCEKLARIKCEEVWKQEIKL